MMAGTSFYLAAGIRKFCWRIHRLPMEGRIACFEVEARRLVGPALTGGALGPWGGGAQRRLDEAVRQLSDARSLTLSPRPHPTPTPQPWCAQTRARP